MDNVVNIYNKKLGQLSYTRGSNGIHCWVGTIDGCEEGFCIVLNDPKIETADISFISHIIQNWKTYIEVALSFVKFKMRSTPEFFGISEDKSAEYLASNHIPIGLPRFLFYESQEWMLHYIECSFTIGDPYGMGVNFEGEKPISLEDFSDSELIEDDIFS